MSYYKKASEIARESLLLANIDNTSSFSHSEIKQYLNDGFVAIYNEMARNGNDYWLKTGQVQRASDKYFLPDDFYIMKQVYGKFHTPIPRASNTSKGYRITNNTIESEMIESIEYYPIPPVLTFPASKREIQLSHKPIATWNNYILFENAELLNIETSETSEIILPDNYMTVQLGNDVMIIDGILYDFNGNNYGENYFLDAYGRAVTIDNHEIKSMLGTVLAKTDAESAIFCSIINDEYKVIEPIADSWNSIAQVDNNVIINFDASSFVLDTKEEMISSELKRIGVVLYNNEYYFLDVSMSKAFIVGAESDTLLNYPNNIFYRALAVYVAIQLLAKQNADTSKMNASFQSLLDTLRKTMNASSDYPIIKQVY